MDSNLLLSNYQISIHALHEESDLENSAAHYISFMISIHALHEESDPMSK